MNEFLKNSKLPDTRLAFPQFNISVDKTQEEERFTSRGYDDILKNFRRITDMTLLRAIGHHWHLYIKTMASLYVLTQY